MPDFSLNFSDPSQNSYYIPILITICAILLIIELFTILAKEYKSDSYQDNNISMNRTLQNNMSYPSLIIINKNKLKTGYLLAYLLARAAMWAKAPYIYTLFMSVHKFSFVEIGRLYLVDAVSALIFGPITGQLADKYGRKKFCRFYNYSVLINIILRLLGDRLTAYLAQIVTGFGSGLINTTFEAWVVSESDREFMGYSKEAERFRRKLFVKANLYDEIISILILIICAVVYSYLGIYAPFVISFTFSLLSLLVIAKNWKENALSKSETIMAQMKGALREFKKGEVLGIGLIEGIVMACLNMFLFSWTPILKQSTSGGMNPGFIFASMVLTMIVGTKICKLLIVYLYCDYFISITGCLFLQGIFLILTYYKDSFLERLIFLCAFDGLIGFYNPVNSVLKSKILVEKYRALLMNLFRVPLNIYVIIVLLTIRYINSFTVALISGILCFLAFGIGLFLVIYDPVKQRKKNEINNQYFLPDEIV